MPDPIDVNSDHRRAALRGSLLAQMPWESAVSGQGLVIRFSTRNMIQEQTDALMSGLEKTGFHPVRHNSATLGPTIRLTGREAALMHQIHKDELAAKAAAPASPPPLPEKQPG